MNPTDKIDRLIKELKTTASPDLDRRIDTLINQNQATRPRPLSMWSIIMKKQTIKIAATAAIVLFVILSLTVFDGPVSEAYAIEQTLAAIQDIRTIHLFGRDWGNSEYEMWIQLNPETGIPDYCWAHYYDTGVLDISRPDQSYQYSKNANRVLVNSGKLYNIGVAPARIFEELIKHSKSDQSGIRIDITREKDPETGQTVIVALLEQPKCGYRIYIDPTTKLPLRFTGLHNSQLGAVFKDIDWIEYNVELPEGIFDYQFPEDARVEDMDHTMNLINDPQNGMAMDGLTEEEAADQITEDFWNASIAGDKVRMLQLAPTGIMQGATGIAEIAEIGKLFIAPGCGIGKILPSTLRFDDGSTKRVNLIIRFRKDDSGPSCVIAGTYGGFTPVE